MIKLRRFLSYATLIFLVLLCLFPFFVLLMNATRAHAEVLRGFSFFPGASMVNNFRNVIENPNMPVIRATINSFILAIGTVLMVLYFSTLTAFGIHAYNFKLKKFAFVFILLIMMLPVQLSALGFIRLVETMNLRNSFIPFIIPAAASPVTFFFMIQYMKSTLSVEIIEAARIDGSNEFMTFNRIVLPLMKPALAVQAIFTFVGTWNSFFMPALLLDDPDMHTLPILISRLRGADFLNFDLGQVYMLIGLSILPVVVVYLILSKYIVAGVSLGGVKG
ncbi:MAG: carbohydrate ABC transporter permease [Turicibacter sp.]|nr:carbohydrate ABC transporter permease [Turicibacter sp.]